MYTYQNEIQDLLRDVPCVLGYGTAADYGGYWCGRVEHPDAHIFVTEPQGIPGTIEHLVSSLEDKEYKELWGIRCTTHAQTIADLLEEDGDQQVIQETLADWYFEHGESYEGLVIPPHLQDTYAVYSEWAKEYYTED